MQGQWHPLAGAWRASEEEPEQCPAPSPSGLAMHRQGAATNAAAVVTARRSARPRRHANRTIPKSLALSSHGGK